MSAENNQGERIVKIVPPEKAVTAVVILALSGALLLLAMFATYVK